MKCPECNSLAQQHKDFHFDGEFWCPECNYIWIPVNSNDPLMIQELLLDFVKDIALGPHSELCPLNHHIYRDNWCHYCEAKRLMIKLEKNTALASTRAGHPWTKYEDKCLKDSFLELSSTQIQSEVIKHLAHDHERSAGSIRSRLHKIFPVEYKSGYEREQTSTLGD